MNILAWSEPQIFAFFFVFIRVTSLILFLPLYGDRVVPAQVKVLLSVAFAWISFPLLWQQGLRVNSSMYTTGLGLTLAMTQEAVFGAVIGFISRWAFDAAQFAGQLIGAAMGLSMASVIDPHTESQTLAISELKYILALLLFLAADGHHLLLTVINDSFRAAPVGQIQWLGKDKQILEYLTEMSAEVLLLSVKLAAPVIVVVFIVNITFGLVSRAVPQMNVFAVSFGANIMVGLFVTLLSIPSFTNALSGVFVDYASHITKFMSIFHG